VNAEEVKGSVPLCRPSYLCDCLQVTEAEVWREAVRNRPGNLKELIRCSGAGQGCTGCHAALRGVLERLEATCRRPPLARLDNFQAQWP
jgi:bacterioferritin-associated ferredoxin